MKDKPLVRNFLYALTLSVAMTANFRNASNAENYIVEPNIPTSTELLADFSGRDPRRPEYNTTTLPPTTWEPKDLKQDKVFLYRMV